MRLLVFLVFVAVLAVSAWEETKSLICKPNKEYKKACNTCKCSVDGTSSDCTNIDCHAEITRANQEAAFPETSAREETKSLICKPNMEYKKACNTCKCSVDGTSSDCTNIDCHAKSTRANQEAAFPGTSASQEAKPVICMPNEWYYEACNTCKCAADGTSRICTLFVCRSTVVEQEAAVPVVSATMERKPGPYYTVLRQPRQVHIPRITAYLVSSSRRGVTPAYVNMMDL